MGRGLCLRGGNLYERTRDLSAWVRRGKAPKERVRRQTEVRTGREFPCSGDYKVPLQGRERVVAGISPNRSKNTTFKGHTKRRTERKEEVEHLAEH